mmetsp:Transcript_8936/g.27695  ORF Transcript_8936/g.27695 Transcript_8936/m.27695 type:complete len:357 (+) Transcript_8936:3-1073(+)
MDEHACGARPGGPRPPSHEEHRLALPGPEPLPREVEALWLPPVRRGREGRPPAERGHAVVRGAHAAEGDHARAIEAEGRDLRVDAAGRVGVLLLKVASGHDGLGGVTARDVAPDVVVGTHDFLHRPRRGGAGLQLAEEPRAGRAGVGLRLVHPPPDLREEGDVEGGPVELLAQVRGEVGRDDGAGDLLQDPEAPGGRARGAEDAQVQHHPLVVVGAAVPPGEKPRPVAAVPRQHVRGHRPEPTRHRVRAELVVQGEVVHVQRGLDDRELRGPRDGVVVVHGREVARRGGEGVQVPLHAATAPHGQRVALEEPRAGRRVRVPGVVAEEDIRVVRQHLEERGAARRPGLPESLPCRTP